MLNQGGITKESGTTRNIILMAPELAFTVSCKVANTGVEAGADGKKIVKAGTPLYGDLTDRGTAFTISGEGSAVGILLHDVDVTAGTKNAQITTFGFVDKSKLDSSVATMLSSAMPVGGITLVQ